MLRPFKFISEGFKGFFRNGLMSVASILVLFSSLFVIGVFATVIFNVNHNLDEMQDFKELVCYMELDAPDEQADVIVKKIKALPNVKKVTKVSPKEALDMEKAKYDSEEYKHLFDIYEDNGSAEAVEEVETAETSKTTDTVENVETVETEGGDVTQDTAEATTPSQATDTLEVTDTAEATDMSETTDTAETAEAEDTAATVETADETEETDAIDEEKAEKRRNPLPYSFRVEYVSVSGIPTLEENLKAIDGIEPNISNSNEIAQNIEKFKNIVTIGGAWLMGLLVIVSVFVIANTIKITYHSRELEISIMRYIGATKFYITMPFVVESLIISAVAAVMGYAAQWYLYVFFVEKITAEYPIIKILPFAEMNNVFLIIYFAASLFIGMFGSIVTIRKYMKV